MVSITFRGKWCVTHVAESLFSVPTKHGTSTDSFRFGVIIEALRTTLLATGWSTNYEYYGKLVVVDGTDWYIGGRFYASRPQLRAWVSSVSPS